MGWAASPQTHTFDWELASFPQKKKQKKNPRKCCLEVFDFQIPTDPWESAIYDASGITPCHAWPSVFHTVGALAWVMVGGGKAVVHPGCSCRMIKGEWTGGCTATGVSCAPICVWICSNNTDQVSTPSPPQSVQQRTSLTSDTEQLRGWGKRDNLERLQSKKCLMQKMQWGKKVNI